MKSEHHFEQHLNLKDGSFPSLTTQKPCSWLNITIIEFAMSWFLHMKRRVNFRL